MSILCDDSIMMIGYEYVDNEVISLIGEKGYGSTVNFSWEVYGETSPTLSTEILNNKNLDIHVLQKSVREYLKRSGISKKHGDVLVDRSFCKERLYIDVTLNHNLISENELNFIIELLNKYHNLYKLD